ncbi:hypothetical protein CGJ91_19815 [Vibrio parahaemolyticus]|nr:hypothetical protein CGJ91_19815 [Vibrio parahaemolyticus]
MFRVNGSCAFRSILSFELRGFWLSEITLRSFSGLFFSFQKPLCLLKASSVALSFQKVFLVLLVRFLRRFESQVVSVTDALKLRLI